MPRYFLDLSYLGSHYHGFQRQPNTPDTIQQKIEDTLSLLCRESVTLLGCGRTDAGVHARAYYAHFDAPGALPENFISRCNRLLGPDIAFRRCFEVPAEFHARFDAKVRAYEYHLLGYKDPFSQELAYSFERAEDLDWDKMQQAAALLLEFEDFAPFCKTQTDAQTRRCLLRRSEWQQLGPQAWIYHVEADRFLRGMVRLIVGMCLYVGQGKMELEAVRHALETQTPLPRPWSAPPQGLALTKVEYQRPDLGC